MKALGQCALAVSTLVGLIGCTSVSSTYITRNPFGCGWKTKHLRGAPVTVTVPSHLEVRVKEVRYMYNGALLKDKVPQQVGADVVLTEVPAVTREVEVFVREKKEVFTVDFVRPAGGIGDFTIDFNDKEQYFTRVKGDVTDETIKDITAAVKNITGQIGKLPGAKAPLALASALPNVRDAQNITRIESVIATRLFDIHDPQIQEDIHEFLHRHLNGCQLPCPPQVPGLMPAGVPSAPWTFPQPAKTPPAPAG